jgi:hypothetical protein
MWTQDCDCSCWNDRGRPCHAENARDEAASPTAAIQVVDVMNARRFCALLGRLDTAAAVLCQSVLPCLFLLLLVVVHHLNL